MKCVVTGARGQLGHDVIATVPSGVVVVGFGHDDLDVTDVEAVDRVLADHAPDVVMNLAAYTAVDRAEQDRDLASRINGTGPANVARAASAGDTKLIHVSTDYVFDGQAATPYSPDAPTNPLNVYGHTKLLGESGVARESRGNFLILRTSSLYGCAGGNFVLAMLGLMGTRDELRVVVDQASSPTWTRLLAKALWRAAESNLVGVHHWSDAGVASKYDFAVAVQEEALACGLLDRAVPIAPCGSEEFPTPAVRPAYSVLDSRSTYAALDLRPAHWREALRQMLHEHAEVGRWQACS